MKRISTLLLAAAMAFGAVGVAEAAELKASGTFDFAFGPARTNTSDRNHKNNGQEEYFKAKQRFRPQLNFVASESLQAVMQLEIGKTNFGQAVGERGGQIDERANNIKVKRLYLDWVIPTTEVTVRMGKQGLALPSGTGFGNPVFDSDVSGIVMSGQINEMVGLTGFWVRPYDDGSNNNHINDELDAFGFVVPVKGEGWSVSPWAMYANIGGGSGYTANLSGRVNQVFADANMQDRIVFRDDKSKGAWWLGFAADYQIMDGLTFGMDAMYGRTGNFDTFYAEDGINWQRDKINARGYFIDAVLAYEIEQVGTASLFGWYASGNKNNNENLRQMPLVGTNGGFAPTSFGTPGSNGIGEDAALTNSGMGTWGLGVALADVTFVQDLSHTFRVAYINGTNGRDTAPISSAMLTENLDAYYLTKKDSAWEFNVDSKYQIYENLAAFVELGYIAVDGKRNTTFNTDNDDNMWKTQVLFQYKF